MATVDYSPLFNSLRNAGTNMANMALKGIEAEGQAAKAALWRDQTLANTDLSNSKAALYKLENETAQKVKDYIDKNGDFSNINTRNEYLNVGKRKPTYSFRNIGNTGATYNMADGTVLADPTNNPVLQTELEGRKARTRASNALTAARSRDRTVVGSSGGTKSATPEGVGLAVLNQLSPLFEKIETVKDQYGMERQIKRVDMPALLKYVVETTMAGGDPRNLMTAARYLHPDYFPAEGAQPPASAPVQETPSAEDAVPTTQPAVSQTGTTDMQQVDENTRTKVLKMYQKGQLSRDEALAIAQANGWEL